jgi:hypothetical protein
LLCNRGQYSEVGHIAMWIMCWCGGIDFHTVWYCTMVFQLQRHRRCCRYWFSFCNNNLHVHTHSRAQARRYTGTQAPTHAQSTKSQPHTCGPHTYIHTTTLPSTHPNRPTHTHIHGQNARTRTKLFMLFATSQPLWVCRQLTTQQRRCISSTRGRRIGTRCTGREKKHVNFAFAKTARRAACLRTRIFN